MAVTPTPIYPQALYNNVIAITNATATAAVTLVTPGTNGTKVESISVTNTDTAAYTLNVFVVISATSYLVSTVTIPLSAGNTAAAPPVDLLSIALSPWIRRDPNGNPYIYLNSGTTLTAAVTSTVTTAKQLAFFVQGGSFLMPGEIAMRPRSGYAAAQSVRTAFNALDYGAQGNGLTDDTAAIQAAIDACALAGGGTVYLPAGVYKVTRTLFVGNGTAAAVSTFPRAGIALVGAGCGFGAGEVIATADRAAGTTLIWYGPGCTRFLLDCPFYISGVGYSDGSGVLIPGTAYFFKIVAYDGSSNFSFPSPEAVDAATATGPAAGYPTGITVPVGSNAIKLQWLAVTGATGYRAYYATRADAGPGGWSYVDLGAGTSNPNDSTYKYANFLTTAGLTTADPPDLATATAGGSGGTITAGSYYFRLIGKDSAGNYYHSTQETLKVTVTAGQQVTLTWINPYPSVITSWLILRGISSECYDTSMAVGNVVTYAWSSDTGAVTGYDAARHPMAYHPTTMLQVNGPIAGLGISGIQFGGRGGSQAAECALRLIHPVHSRFTDIQLNIWSGDGLVFTCFDNHAAINGGPLGVSFDRLSMLGGNAWTNVLGSINGILLGPADCVPVGSGGRRLDVCQTTFNGVAMYGGPNGTILTPAGAVPGGTGYGPLRHGIQARFTNSITFTELVLVGWAASVYFKVQTGITGFPNKFNFYVCHPSTSGIAADPTWAPNYLCGFFPFDMGDGSDQPPPSPAVRAAMYGFDNLGHLLRPSVQAIETTYYGAP